MKRFFQILLILGLLGVIGWMVGVMTATGYGLLAVGICLLVASIFIKEDLI